MDDNNPNEVTAEICLKIISLIYSTPSFSRDFIPSEVASLKFKHSNNIYRIEWKGAVSLRQTGRREVFFWKSNKKCLKAEFFSTFNT